MRIGDGGPVVLTGGGRTLVELQRVSPTDTRIAEDLIQRLVVEHPSVLPVEQLDPMFAPPVPIGREIGTSVGPIDALFISPQGGITIVEAKLWRNPQARREVVGQIIDYATALSTWTYEELDQVCRQATSRSLWQTVASAHDEPTGQDEARFVDAVARNLRYGRFLLLVVGDGIREEVERMASYVQDAPRLQFHLALVELGIYDSDDGEVRTIVPSVVARTAEITRAVVRVDVAEHTNVGVDVSVPVDDSPRSRRTLTMEQFFAEMTERTDPATVRFYRDILDEFDVDDRFQLLPRAASVSLRLRHPDGGYDFTVLVFETGGRAYPGWLHGQCKKAGVPVEVAYRYVADLSQILDIPVDSKYADSLTTSAKPDVVMSNWDVIRRRIDELADEIHRHLEQDDVGTASGGSVSHTDG